MARRTATAIFLVLSLLATAYAQDEANRSEILEVEALSAEARGRYEEALGAYEKALTESVREAAEEADPDRKARTLARTEFYLEKVGGLTEKTSRFTKTREFLEGVSGEAVGPTLSGWIDWYRARALVAEGKLRAARNKKLTL